jgi:hypothetical protein
MTSDPDLSLVIVSPSYDHNLIACLDSVASQRTEARYEVLVAGRTGHDPEELVGRFPEVTSILVRERRTPGELRNAAIDASSGRYVAFLHVNCRIPEGWVDLLLETHARKAAPIACGPLRNGASRSPVATASFFFERNVWFALRREGWVANAPAVNLSYSRDLLSARSYSDMPFGSDLELHRRLRADQRDLIYFNPALAASYHGPERLRHYLAYGFTEGERFARSRVRGERWTRRRAVLYTVFAWTIAPLMLYRTLRAIRGHDTRDAFLKSAPLVALGWGARALGEQMVYLRSAAAGHPA